jgi:serine/threonine protein kinase
MRIALKWARPFSSVRLAKILFVAQVMPLPPDTMLGRYEIRSLLGTGGMGEVYLAYDTQLRRQVAIKLLPGE